MIDPISSFLFTATGTFVIWMFKGFKGSFDSHMVSVGARHTRKGNMRFYLGLGIWIGLLVGVYVIFSPQEPVEAKAYKIRMNQQGEVEVEELKAP